MDTTEARDLAAETADRAKVWAAEGRRAEILAALAERVMENGGMRPSSVTRNVQFDLSPGLDVVHPDDSSRRIRLYRIHVNVSRYPGEAFAGSVYVTGFGKPLTDSGQPDARVTRDQAYTLPEAFAATALYLADVR